MRRIAKALLVLEVTICFGPTLLALIWMSTVMAVPFVMSLRGHEHEGWSDWAGGLPQFLGTLLGCVAVLGLMCFVLVKDRLMPQSMLAVCCLAGLTTLTAAAFSQGSLSMPALFFLWAPALCGLHLLYLGRSYFIRANKTMEPTR
jgi:hypothetical protein